MATKLSSADIKKQLATSTGVPASKWSRWAKYKVGSPTDMEAPKDSSWNFCKGLKFGEHYPHLAGVWVRLYGADSDQPVTGVAVFEKDGVILDILGITETKNDCGAPQPGRLRDPEGWESYYGGACADIATIKPAKKAKKKKKKQMLYNIVTQIGYVESSQPSMLWWTHMGDIGKTAQAVAEELRDLFINFYKEEFVQRDCCAGQKPSKKSKFCGTCGKKLGSGNSFYGDAHLNRVEYAIRDLHVGCVDSIMGDCRRNDGYDLDEYLQAAGWEFWQGFSTSSSGPLILIRNFDDYVLSHQCWGDYAHGYYDNIIEMKVSFK